MSAVVVSCLGGRFAGLYVGSGVVLHLSRVPHDHTFLFFFASVRMCIVCVRLYLL